MQSPQSQSVESGARSPQPPAAPYDGLTAGKRYENNGVEVQWYSVQDSGWRASVLVRTDKNATNVAELHIVVPPCDQDSPTLIRLVDLRPGQTTMIAHTAYDSQVVNRIIEQFEANQAIVASDLPVVPPNNNWSDNFYPTSLHGLLSFRAPYPVTTGDISELSQPSYIKLQGRSSMGQPALLRIRSRNTAQISEQLANSLGPLENIANNPRLVYQLIPTLAISGYHPMVWVEPPLDRALHNRATDIFYNTGQWQSAKTGTLPLLPEPPLAATTRLQLALSGARVCRLTAYHQWNTLQLVEFWRDPEQGRFTAIIGLQSSGGEHWWFKATAPKAEAELPDGIDSLPATIMRVMSEPHHGELGPLQTILEHCDVTVMHQDGATVSARLTERELPAKANPYIVARYAWLRHCADQAYRDSYNRHGSLPEPRIDYDNTDGVIRWCVGGSDANREIAVRITDSGDILWVALIPRGTLLPVHYDNLTEFPGLWIVPNTVGIGHMVDRNLYSKFLDLFRATARGSWLGGKLPLHLSPLWWKIKRIMQA